ncbi:hypothetical protein R0137_14730 [Congregibacter brevis]|uniref:Uncharacterized protein n=1 Tax=Congregibacter brevis TaxID=3081201 RepID=A0ABZ0IBP1_9GAMM|nr:hypothetical protein R0137_14730 [Congregibacter sp. IMCC45268]
MTQNRLIRCFRFVALSFALAQAALVVAQQETASPYPSGEEREFHTIGDVPTTVVAVAKRNAPSVVFSEAESYWEADVRVYRLSGRLYREVWQVYVTEQGQFLYSESDLQDD